MQGRYAFLKTPRWIALMVLAALACATCLALGYWQFSRYQDRAEAANQVEEAWEQTPVALGELADGLVIEPEDVWRPVVLEGSFAAESDVVLRNRPVDGTPAHQILTPFLTNVDGADVVVIVNRGWLPAEQVDAGDIPGPPSGHVTLNGRARTAEAPIDRQTAPGTAYTITPQQIVDQLSASEASGPAAQLANRPVVNGWVQAEEPIPAETLRGFPAPDTSLGPHLSYAFQWLIFAIASLAFVPILARREADDADEELLIGTEYERPARARSGNRDAEEEDAWLDAIESGRPLP